MKKSNKYVTMEFNDRLSFDSIKKTVISVRDGVLEYLGVEIGAEPPDKVFRVFRSPATIANAATAMSGIPVTDEHVSLDEPPTDPIGNVDSSEIVDLVDGDTDTRIGVKNGVHLKDAGQIDEKHELSLGYTADLVESEGTDYDFEQKNIMPHHLAIVKAGRCGPACSFIDKKGKTEMKKKKKFLDEEGKLSLQAVIEMAKGFPEMLKAVPVDKLSEIMPLIQEIVAMTKAEEEGEPMEEDPGTEPVEKAPVVDEDVKTKDEDPKPDDEEEKTPMKDSAAFKDAVACMIKSHTETIEKAHGFVDEGFVFAGKTTPEIMRAALATEYGKQTFTDAELPVAFKMLKKAATNLTNFGDSKDAADKLTAIGDKEI